MAGKKEDEPKEIYFQTAFITFKHPASGEPVTRKFIGKALFSPEELEKFGDVPLEDIFEGLAFDKPYNPYEDPDNSDAHRHLTNAVREAVRRDES